VPRAILMDLEPGTMDSVRSGPYGQVSLAYSAHWQALGGWRGLRMSIGAGTC
jgi:hypothetical protein